MIDGDEPVNTNQRRQKLPIVIGGFLAVSSIAVAVLSWIILGMLHENVRDHEDVLGRAPALLVSVLENRSAVSVAALGGVVFACLLIAGRMNRGAAWVIAAAGTLWLVAVLAVVLASFVTFLAPLYEYRPM